MNFVFKGKQRRHWYEAFTIWSRPGLQESSRYKLDQIYGMQAIFIHIRSKVEFFDNSYALLDLIIAIRSSEHTLFQKASRILLTWSVSLSFIAIFTIHLTFIPSPHPQLSLWWPAAICALITRWFPFYGTKTKLYLFELEFPKPYTVRSSYVRNPGLRIFWYCPFVTGLVRGRFVVFSQ